MHGYTYISFKNRIYIKIHMYMFECVCLKNNPGQLGTGVGLPR